MESKGIRNTGDSFRGIQVELYDSSTDDEDHNYAYEEPANQPPSDCFIHSDIEFSLRKKESVLSLERPASTPGGFPGISDFRHRNVNDPSCSWFVQPPHSLSSSLATAEEDKQAKNRVRVWISRLDRLISNSSLAEEDQVEDSCSASPGVTSSASPPVSSSTSHDTLTSSSSSSSAAAEGRGPSPCPSLDEVLRDTVCQSTFGSQECLIRTDPVEKPFQRTTAATTPMMIRDNDQMMMMRDNDQAMMIRDNDQVSRERQEKAEEKPVEMSKGVICSDISQAYEILNTKYRLENVSVRRPVITWSKWNVSQMVRGPHANSPIWNSTMKTKWDRPSSTVFHALNDEINRRDKELDRIVRKKTASVIPPSSSSRPLSSSSPGTSSPYYSLPLHQSSGPLPSPLPPDVLSCPVPSQSVARRRPSSVIATSFLQWDSAPAAQIPPQTYIPTPGPTLAPVNPELGARVTSRSEPGQAVTLDEQQTDESQGQAPSVSPAARSPQQASTSTSASAGVSLIRRMVNSLWTVFVGDSGCRGGVGRSRNDEG